MTFKLPKTKEMDERLTAAGFDAPTYETVWKQYKIKLDLEGIKTVQDELQGLIRQAWELVGKG